MKTYLLLLIMIFSISLFGQNASKGKNGFTYSSLTIDADAIHQEAKKRDKIPAIDNPQFTPQDKVDFLEPGDLVIGLDFEGQNKAYPIKILNWHEIVNDKGVLVTYCPLCGSGLVFRSYVGKDDLTFGVSGLVYNNDVLMYDRETESLWSQLDEKAVSGAHSGHQLEYVPTALSTWADWSKQHPGTEVLNMNTGFTRDYTTNPYERYENSDELIYPVEAMSRELPSKEMVLGIRVGDKYKAYPIKHLKKSNAKTITDQFNGRDIIIKVDEDYPVLISRIDENIEAVTLYWFAWYAFHPDTEIYKD